MKLSIITINFNNAEGLRRTIGSVRAQTFRDFEHIVIDGASTDCSVDVIKQYADGLSYWVSEKDNGIYNAMNKGILAAKGEYTLFLNSGDYLYADDVLEKVFENQFDEDIVSCGCLDYWNKKKQILHLPPKKISLYSLYKSSLSHPSTFIKRKLFESIGFYHEEYKIISDWCFFVEALIFNNCSFTYMDIVLVFFPCDGISSTNHKLNDKEQEHYRKTHYPRIWKDFFLDEYTHNCLYNIYNSHKYLRKALSFICRVINSVFKLRSKNGQKIRIINYDSLNNIPKTQ